MKLFIVTVGHKPPPWIEQAFQQYRQRLPNEMHVTMLCVKPSGYRDSIQGIKVERDRILAVLPTRSYLIVLDEKGAAWRTADLARKLGDVQQLGKNIVFIIGGTDGLHTDIKCHADQLLQFSAFTFPHDIVRLLLIEQIYRVSSILRNHPYHRE